MKIGFDARLINESGVGRYIRNLLRSLSDIDDKNEYLIYLPSSEFNKFKIKNKLWTKKTLNVRWHSIKEQIILPDIFSGDNPDLIHFPYFSIPVNVRQKFVLTIHDLIIDHFPTGKASSLPYIYYLIKRFGYKYVLNQSMNNAEQIIAISNSTKKEISEHYPNGKDKINVVYNGIDDFFVSSGNYNSIRKLYDFAYILYVGNAYPHKNLERLIQAIKKLSLKTEVKLVLAGDDLYFYPRLKAYAKVLGISDKIIFFGNASDDKLISLYRYAKLLVFPSLMEGFGFPILEGVACGILPVVSDIPVFREIWGNDLVYFNPEDINDIAEKIKSALVFKSYEYKKRLHSASKKIAKFRWITAARETLKIYEKARKT